MNISVVIPLLNEEESLVELCDLIANVMNQHQYSYEVLLIDDGSKDNSWKVIENICSGNQYEPSREVFNFLSPCGIRCR